MKTSLPLDRASWTIPVVDISPVGMERNMLIRRALVYSGNVKSLLATTVAKIMDIVSEIS